MSLSAASRTCCPMFQANDMASFGRCVHNFGVFPVCDGNLQGCFYGSKFFRVGSTVKLVPSKCLKFVCTAVTAKLDALNETTRLSGHVIAHDAKTVELQVKQVSHGCECCVYDGELYADGSWIQRDHTRCVRSLCSKGVWKDVGNVYHLSESRIDRQSSFLDEKDEEDFEGQLTEKERASFYSNDYTCCFHEGRYYFEGETIALYNKSYGSDCEKDICLKGKVTKCYFECCCIEGNEMYSCYSDKALPSSNFETCTIRKCCDGFIHEFQEPGCCSVDGQVYKQYQEVGLTDDGCQIRRCIQGQVVLEDAGRCCLVDGHYVHNGEVVESNPEKCIMKICRNLNIVELSKDTCPCCLYNDELFVNGSVIKRECVQLTCVNGIWKEEEHICCDFCQIHTGTNYFTFDGTSYFHNGVCNVTLVQDHYYGYDPTNFIALSFKMCGFPFTEKATCNGVLTIKHNYHTVITLSPGKTIQVNGRTITELPYGENDLFIWENAFTYRVLTFDDLMVEYGKSNPPIVRVYTPNKNRGRLFGLCGAYDGSVYRDLRPRNAYSFFFQYSTEYFYNSWKTRESGCKAIIDWEEACTGVSSERKEHIKKLCEAKITCGTGCGHDSLGVKAVQERCLSDLCYCRPDCETKCLVVLEEELIHLCRSVGGNILLQCTQQGGNTSAINVDTFEYVK
ncbi:mucin-19-like isoform X2 [Oratosquilla oratoria]|uniref:mucin-19-like isoform X2 n=1 Tax=Oratosquilla oratoria TaxID=337810 RepID=UPI003F770B82